MNWKDIVKNVAPAIGAALGGPMGGMATKFIAEKLLGREDATESDVADYMLTASPEKLVELKKLEADFKVRMRELDIDVFALEVQDRDSARQLFKVNIWPQIVLSTIYILGYFVVLYTVLTQQFDIPQNMEALVNVLIGVMTAAVPTILQFWFGSSVGSKEKTMTIKNE